MGLKKWLVDRAMANAGLVEARISFGDGSFADDLVMDHESFADFWTAAAAIGR